MIIVENTTNTTTNQTENPEYLGVTYNRNYGPRKLVYEIEQLNILGMVDSDHSILDNCKDQNFKILQNGQENAFSFTFNIPSNGSNDSTTGTFDF